MSVERRPRVAIVGAGPAGIYAADILQARDAEVEIDIFERLPAPYGLVRYGVAPDHPRIKKIGEALHDVLCSDRIRLLCNVSIGDDLAVDELRQTYDAVIIATGADADAHLEIPGVGLPGSFGAADFVSWYDGHPDVPRSWPLTATSIAVLGAGNVALDIARVLAKHAVDLEHTDIPDNVHAALADSRVRDIHLFARRGPADVRFSPLELRELGHQHDVDVIVDPADMELDEHAERMVAQFTQRRIVVETLTGWSRQDPDALRGSRRIHLHFYQRPTRLLGDDVVTGIEMERTAPDELGRVTGTGEFVTHDVQAVYRAIGYRSTPVPGLPFDTGSHVIPNIEGRVTEADGTPMPGVYTTGWIKRGPIGLIGSTKSDAAQTVTHLLADLGGDEAGGTAASGAQPLLAARDVPVVDWTGWLRIDEAERRFGASRGRERTKLIDRREMLELAR